MYDDGWYNTFVPRVLSSHHLEAAGLKRRETPNVRPPSTHGYVPMADFEMKEGLTVDSNVPETLLNVTKPDDPSNGPPAASVARRAKSYSDFYDVVRAYVKKEHRQEKKQKRAQLRKEGLRNESEFVTWYGGVKSQLEDASHEEYQVYREQLRLAESHLDRLLASANSTLDLLQSLSNSFNAVDKQTTAFQAECEDILNDQKRTTKLADAIGENVQYYTYLDPIQKRLNAPGAANLVRRKEFAEMLSNLDVCLDYMDGHPNQKDSAAYRSRYRMLLTRALTLTRNAFTSSLREISADVSKRIAERQLNDTTMSALLYAKFRVGAPEMKALGLEIQKRAGPPPNAEPGQEGEYQSLMNELYQAYSSTRYRLLSPVIAKKMADIAAAPSTSKDLVAFARSAITFIRGLCQDEYELWHAWFESDGGLYDFLETLLEPFYDYLRPRTIHEVKLLKLCELCTLLQTRYMSDDDDDIIESPHGPKLDFATLIHPALEDAQTRLVFLAMTVLRNDIEYFKPTPSDLDYPAKNLAVSSRAPILSGRKASSTNGPIKAPTVVEEDGLDATPFLTANTSDWYPTLSKAVWLLSRIYHLVHSRIFDDLAHQIVHQTTHSLLSASTLIGKSASPTDARLFLLKSLLTLKQQIVAFDIEFASQMDVQILNGLTQTFWELRDRGGLFDLRSWVRLVAAGLAGTGLVVRNMFDAKAELDAELRKVINEVVQGFAERMTEGIGEGAMMKDGSRFDAKAASVEVRGRVEKDVPFLRRKLEEYVEDTRTRETLVQAVMDAVCAAYEEFFEKVGEEGARKGRSKGKGREDSVWDSDVFGEWAERVFAVRRMGFEDGDGDDAGSMEARSESGSL